MQPCSVKFSSSEIKPMEFKSEIIVHGNKPIHQGFHVGAVGLQRRIAFFLSHFPHLLLAALVENRGGPHEAVRGVGTIAAV